MKARGKREIPVKKKNRGRAASPGTIPTCENLEVTRTGIEPGSPWWATSRLTAQPPRLGRPQANPFSDWLREALQALLTGLLIWLPRTVRGSLVAGPPADEEFTRRLIGEHRSDILLASGAILLARARLEFTSEPTGLYRHAMCALSGLLKSVGGEECGAKVHNGSDLAILPARSTHCVAARIFIKARVYLAHKPDCSLFSRVGVIYVPLPPWDGELLPPPVARTTGCKQPPPPPSRLQPLFLPDSRFAYARCYNELQRRQTDRNTTLFKHAAPCDQQFTPPPRNTHTHTHTHTQHATITLKRVNKPTTLNENVTPSAAALLLFPSSSPYAIKAAITPLMLRRLCHSRDSRSTCRNGIDLAMGQGYNEFLRRNRLRCVNLLNWRARSCRPVGQCLLAVQGRQDNLTKHRGIARDLQNSRYYSATS
ncbi:hypothetical protein PR048_017693 [Dryococelus australis]|uniref:Uncharacterized protein n=1 Tax=Dryococelus australis TaxID=614101 RepID=A0ABQ9HAB9_9NEOP|nr:hypothetical protein PR048_017693 [Dryococelus australis]